jgi:hypothetical protein
MATSIRHRQTKIVSLDKGEEILKHCVAGDIAICERDDGWWTCFVGEDGDISDYDAPFPSYNKALWTAKAAAEFEDQ